MSELDIEEFAEFIRGAVKPSNHQLSRDLWPEMHSKLRRPSMQVPWFDWVLAAIVMIVCLLIPETAAGLIFHL